MVTGIPAKVIGYVDDQDPSLTMKHGMFVLADWQYILFSWKLALLRFSFIMIYIPHMHVNISRNWLFREEGKKKVMLPSPARVSSSSLYLRRNNLTDLLYQVVLVLQLPS